MAYLYFEDDNPFPEEYANNYIYFNEKDPEAFRQAVKILKNQKRRKYNRKKDESSKEATPKRTT